MKIILISAIILSCFFCFSCEKTNENSVKSTVENTVENTVTKTEAAITTETAIKTETAVKTENRNLGIKRGKGFYLSAEQKDNEWVFSLKPSYNRIVTEKDILKATGVENIKKLLETVSENNTIRIIPNKDKKYPPSEILNEIQEYCKKINLDMEIN